MPKLETISAPAVRSFLGGCRLHGVDPGLVLERLGEPRTLLDDPDARFPVDKVRDLLSAISRELQDESLGFLQRPVRIGGLKMSVHATITSKTLGEAFHRWNLFWRLVQDRDFCSVTVQGDEARLVADVPVRGSLDRTAFVIWSALFVLRWANWLVEKPILLDRLHFPFDKPADSADYAQMFACRHYFGQPRVEAVLNRRFLDLPVVQTAETVPEFVRMIPNLLTVERIDRSLTADIRRTLQKTPNSIDALPLKVIAHELGKSQDTLRRQLKREGSSYAEIKESVRRDLAIFHLTARNTPIGEIAVMVGFSEPSVFSRAFKKWTGLTPGEYRAAERGDP